jgi:CHAT domain-containing protein/tetratricopeptide (TPR) repeat protein
LYLLLLGILIAANINSQDHIDSDHKKITVDNFYKKAIHAFNTNNYDSAIYYYKNAIPLFADLNNRNSIIKCNLRVSDAYYSKGLYDSSYTYALIARSEVLRYKISDSTMIGSMYYTIGNLFTKFNEVDSAEYFLNLSLIYCKNGLNDSLYSLVNKAIGNINFSQRKYQDALLFYRKSLQSEMARVHPSEALIASLYQNMGIIMTAIGFSDSARYYFETSITLKEKIYNADDPQLAKGYLNIGRFLQIQGDLLEALSYQDKAEKIYHERFGNDYAGLAPIYWNKGAIYIVLNDYDRALSYHERALDLYLQQLDSEHYIINEIYLNLGLLYSITGQFQLAIEYYTKGLNKNLSPDSYVKAYRNLANCYYKLGEHEKAEDFYKLSINEAKKYFGNDHYITGDSYAGFGVFCNNLGRNTEAEKYLISAFNILSNYFGVKNRNVSDVLESLGNLYRSENKYNKALESYQKALISYIDNFNDESIYSNPAIENIDPDINIFQALNQKAHTFLDIYSNTSNEIKDLEASLETSFIAIELFESIMSSFKDEKTKILINDYNYEIYNLAVIIAKELYERTLEKEYLSLAFEFSEKGKSAVLLSSLRELEAKEVGSIPDTIRMLEQKLNRELSVYKNYVYDESQKSEPDSSKLSDWKKIIFEKSLTYDSLIASIENIYPEYYNLKYRNEVITLKQIQDQLDDNRAFIEYKMADSLLLIFFISKDTTILSSRILSEEFKTRVVNYVSTLNKFPDVSNKSESLRDFMNKSQYLFDILIGESFPIQNYTNLIIVPDDILGYLSFETLVNSDDTTAKSKFKDFDYLIQSHSIAYSYSGTLLFQHLLKEKHNKINYLAMAPTYSNIKNTAGDSYASLRDIEKYLIPLQYTMEEVKNIGAVFSGKLLLEGEATEANFKKYASNYGILHFAMHAFINDEDPLTSKLIFTLDNDTLEDGFLNTYEIYNLNLNADLAVLSACRTGVGKLSKGEGIMSLARGFLYAGVPGIVMTLWEVEDISSANIMAGFYRNLKEGLPKDIALRNSKLAYLNSANQLQSHPYFWAAFVQIGDNSPVISKILPKYLIYGVLIILIIGAFLLYRILKIKRHRKLNSNLHNS